MATLSNSLDEDARRTPLLAVLIGSLHEDWEFCDSREIALCPHHDRVWLRNAETVQGAKCRDLVLNTTKGTEIRHDRCYLESLVKCG